MFRESTFLRHDIEGTVPRQIIPKEPKSLTYQLSTYIEPVPDRSKHITIKSDPLFIDDIEGSRPKCNGFKSRRVVDPLCPKYLLPSSSEILADPGQKFIRDTLEISDINGKRQNWVNRGREILKEPIEGSSPSQLTKQLRSVPRLEVQDINKDRTFESSRHCNPLNPHYHWRDQDDQALNTAYGQIKGAEVKRIHPISVNRDNTLNLNVRDIEGTQANSFFARSHFVDVFSH